MSGPNPISGRPLHPLNVENVEKTAAQRTERKGKEFNIQQVDDSVTTHSVDESNPPTTVPLQPIEPPSGQPIPDPVKEMFKEAMFTKIMADMRKEEQKRKKRKKQREAEGL